LSPPKITIVFFSPVKFVFDNFADNKGFEQCAFTIMGLKLGCILDAQKICSKAGIVKIAEIAQGLKYFLMFLHSFQYRSGCSLDKNGQQGCPFYKFLDKTL